jgi:hypothetical protein
MRWLGPESVPDTYPGSRKNYLVSRVSWVLWRPSIPSARTTSGLRSRLFFFVLYDNSLQLLALFPIAVFYSGTLVALPTLGRECMRSVGANMVGLSGGISSGVVVRGAGGLYQITGGSSGPTSLEKWKDYAATASDKEGYSLGGCVASKGFWIGGTGDWCMYLIILAYKSIRFQV